MAPEVITLADGRNTGVGPPVAYARRPARELPHATLHVSDASGHDVGLDRSAEIMSVLGGASR